MAVEFKSMDDVELKDLIAEGVIDYATWETYNRNPLGTGEFGRVAQAGLVNVGGRYVSNAIFDTSGLVKMK